MKLVNMIKNFFIGGVICYSLISFESFGCVLEKAEAAFKQISENPQNGLSLNVLELKAKLEKVLREAIKKNLQDSLLMLNIHEVFTHPYHMIQNCFYISDETRRDALLGFLAIGHQVLLECSKEKLSTTPFAISYFIGELKSILNDFYSYENPLSDEEKSDEVMTDSSDDEGDSNTKVVSLNDLYEQIGREQETCLKVMQEADAVL